MPYAVVEDFSLGMDLRKSAVTASAKSLRLLVNAYVNAGGEIEKRRWFELGVPAGGLGGTYGLGSLGLSIWAFGATARPASLAVQIGYLQLVGANIARISDVDVFDNQFYVVVQQPDNTFKHYYNGALVADAPNAPTVMAHRSKMYAVAGNIVYFSMLNNPAVWTPGPSNTGAGFIQLDGHDQGAISLVGLAAYYDQLALFGRNSIQLWAMDEDPAQNQLISTLGGTGLVAPKALARYATGDVLYLTDSGVRSLKARDSSNAAIVSDVGSPMDEVLTTLVTEARKGTVGTIVAGVPDSLIEVTGITEPTTGQFWLVANQNIYVLSIAASSHISAWSRYDLGFTATYPVEVAGAVTMRAGDDLRIYGTGHWEGYDTSTVEVITPMIAGNEPATNKQYYGLDAALEGTWQIEVGTDPAQPDVRELVATVTGPTFGLQNLGLQNQGTHITARLTCSDAARARIGSLMFHYSKGSVD